jgi:hypothetical protein
VLTTDSVKHIPLPAHWPPTEPSTPFPSTWIFRRVTLGFWWHKFVWDVILISIIIWILQVLFQSWRGSKSICSVAAVEYQVPKFAAIGIFFYLCWFFFFFLLLMTRNKWSNQVPARNWNYSVKSSWRNLQSYWLELEICSSILHSFEWFDSKSSWLGCRLQAQNRYKLCNLKTLCWYLFQFGFQKMNSDK